jgi:hypothetical protein
MKHIFHDDCEWVIAISPKDAERVSCDMRKDEPDLSEERIKEWKQLPDDENLPVWFEEWHGKIDSCNTIIPRSAKIDHPEEKLGDYDVRVTATAGSWAKSNKRSWLSSTEF